MKRSELLIAKTVMFKLTTNGRHHIILSSSSSWLSLSFSLTLTDDAVESPRTYEVQLRKKEEGEKKRKKGRKKSWTRSLYLPFFERRRIEIQIEKVF